MSDAGREPACGRLRGALVPWGWNGLGGEPATGQLEPRGWANGVEVASEGRSSWRSQKSQKGVVGGGAGPTRWTGRGGRRHGGLEPMASPKQGRPVRCFFSFFLFMFFNT